MARTYSGGEQHQIDEAAYAAALASGGSVLNGLTDRRGRSMLKLLTITRRIGMAQSAIHPGEHLAEELKELGMSAAELARKVDVPTTGLPPL
jgi:hypothetical protein